MKMMILATATILSLGTRSSYADMASQNANRQVTVVASGTMSTNSIKPDTAAYHWNQRRPVDPNPWDGTESWMQWNRDHPSSGGG
jgi:hypothetical protein